MVKISVIIPVYNVEDYLEETMESIVNQTVFSDIEVIMIDDGSTDDSRFLIEKYALDYENIHTYHKQNEGQGVARNYGLKLAKGEYIHFMDSDDYIPPDAYEKLLNTALKNDNKSDVIIGNVLRFRRYNAWDSILFKNSHKHIHEEITCTTLNETHDIIWDTIASNKLFKKEFLEKNNIYFPDEKIYYEDILFSLKSYIYAESISIIPDVIYYWRVRRDKSSVTQQLSDSSTFCDRINILKACLKLMNENNVSKEILHKQYAKWLINDFKTFLKHFGDFHPDVRDELLDGVNYFLVQIPNEIKNNLNSYLKILYAMVENRDVEGLINFAGLEKELKLNPHVPKDLNEKYIKYIDFENDGLGEELNAEVFEVTNDENNLYLHFTEQINYINENNPHKTEAFLIDNDKQFALEVKQLKDNIIVLPVDLIKDKSHLNIKMIYKTGSNQFESLLTNKRRNSVKLDDFYADIGIGFNHVLYIDSYKTTNNKIEITHISFEDNKFIFCGVSETEISEMFIQNVIDFSRIYYDVEYVEGNEFIFTVPYSDILKAVIKKWELNCSDSINSVELLDKFKFYTKNSSIFFTNARNKILITEDILNPVDGLNAANEKFEEVKAKYINGLEDRKRLKKEVRLLNKEIKSLNKEVKYLNNRVEEFKSRKVVRFADKLNF